jgi:hypothetical protein
MTAEEPQVRVDIELCNDLALAILAASVADVGDAVDHQHVRGGQLRITWAEQFAAAAAQQVFPGEGVLFGHASSSIFPMRQGWVNRPGRSRGYCASTGSLVIDCCVVVKVTAR